MTFQLAQVVVLAMEVTKVFSQDRVLFSLCRADRRHSCAWPFVWIWRPSRFTPWTEFNSRLPSRTLTFQLLVVVFKVIHPDQGPAAFFPISGGDAFQGFFFALFSGGKKVHRSLRTRGRNWVRTSAHPRRRLITTTSGLMRPAACG